jgi:hypothetical protein
MDRIDGNSQLGDCWALNDKILSVSFSLLAIDLGLMGLKDFRLMHCKVNERPIVALANELSSSTIRLSGIPF